MKEKPSKSKIKIGKYVPAEKRFIGITFDEEERKGGEVKIIHHSAGDKTNYGELRINNPIEHPNHYTWIPGIECFDVVKHFDFCRGAAIKYIWRSGKKGNEIEDLEKAIQCLKKRIEFLKND